MIKIVVGSNTFYIPLVDGSPIWSGFDSSVIAQLQSAYDSDNYQLIPASEPQALSPNWEELKNRALAGDLYPIFQRLTIASLAPDANTISTARGDITGAILTVKIEAALASGFNLLTQIGGYVFTQEEKDMWKSAVDELNFSSLIYLP